MDPVYLSVHVLYYIIHAYMYICIYVYIYIQYNFVNSKLDGPGNSDKEGGQRGARLSHPLVYHGTM